MYMDKMRVFRILSVIMKTNMEKKTVSSGFVLAFEFFIFVARV